MLNGNSAKYSEIKCNMNRQEILEQLRAQSQIAYAQAKMDRLHEANISAYTNTSAAGGSGGGGGNNLPSNAIEFVVNTYFSTYFEFDFHTLYPINFTIEWGDGTSHIDEGGGGGYQENHTYPESDQEYTARIYFSDISLVTQINFPGND